MGYFCSSFWLLLLLLALAPSPALCLHELLTADGSFLKNRGAKGIATEGKKGESSPPCQSAAVDKVTPLISGKIRPSLSLPMLGKQSALFPCAAFAAQKEHGCFLNNWINISLNHWRGQSVALQSLHNLAATLLLAGLHRLPSHPQNHRITE